MRTVIKVNLNNEKATAAIDEGRMQQELGRALEQLKPEAAYFFPEQGRRTALFIFDMEDSSQLPPLTEPFFRLADEVLVAPAMNGDDLQRGLSQISG